MDENEFNQAVENVVNSFMSHIENRMPEEVLNLAMAVFVNLIAFIPYPVIRKPQAGGELPQEYKDLVMELLPQFTAEIRGHVGQFLTSLVNQSLHKGITNKAEFEFLGKNFPIEDIPEPPSNADN